jgi:hypothetical protein
MTAATVAKIGHRHDQPGLSVVSVATVYFVIQRQDGHWSKAAKVMSVHPTEPEAELAARHLKETYPHQCFGVAVLRSEARHVPKPIEIVRAN